MKIQNLTDNENTKLGW